MRTRITSTRPASLSAPPPPKGKQNKKKPAPTPESTIIHPPTGTLWEVETEDTPIFPEGGGQPFDTGRMVVEDANGGKKEYVVEGCMRRGLDAVHLIRVQESGNGFENLEGEVELIVDWERRVDHVGHNPCSAIAEFRQC
jgi:Ser-tRNA(Ala) deacylase AlaX